MRIQTSNPSLKSYLFLSCFAIIILSVVIVLSSVKNARSNQGDKTMQNKTIEEVLREYTNELMSIPSVVGTAQGLCNGKPCIKVFVIKTTSDLERKIPKVLEGYPVIVEETGEFRALPEYKINRKLTK
jgi:hypothetical protein